MFEDRKTPARWFALAVKPRFDQAVALALEEKGYETLLPMYRKQHRYAARVKEAELPLLPGYVCCRFEPEARLPILDTAGVIQVLGAGNLPIALSEVEVNSLRAVMRARLPVEPFPFLSAGQRVRIHTGALAGVEGIVISSQQRLRLALSITLLHRSVLVEIGRELVSAEEVAAWGDPGAGRPNGKTTFDVAQGD